MSRTDDSKLYSTLGRPLLNELQNPSTARLDIILDYIRKDPLAGRLKDAETGDNSYHLLLGGAYDETFILNVLDALLDACPEGLRAQNKNLSLPLHISLCSYVLLPRVVLKVLEAYPNGAGVKNSLGLVPLFLCVMREDASAELCKALCKAYPSGPSTINPSSHSFPLHYASKRIKPNMAILKMLIKRFPDATERLNSFGMLPIHCLCTSSDSVEAAKLLLNVHPETIKIRDKQGRTCLHLAVLAVGKEHSDAITKEETIIIEKLNAEQSSLNQNTDLSSTDPNGNFDNGDDYFEPEEEVDTIQQQKMKKLNKLQERHGTRSRNLVRYLIDQYPAAMNIPSNFFFTPLQTVLEKTRSMKTHKKVVTVFGLADDPPTARILLLAQLKYSRLDPRNIYNLSISYIQMLKELNWLARREAMLISYEGEPRPGSKNAMLIQTIRNQLIKKSSIKMSDILNNKSNPLNQMSNNKKKIHPKGKGVKILTMDNNSSNSSDASDVVLLKQMEEMKAMYQSDISIHNILARLRRQGFNELIQTIITWI